MQTRPPLVLASASPRRRRLLAQAGLRFRIEPAELEERALPGESPGAQAARLAREKAARVADRCAPDARSVVLAADTLVALDDLVLGKPADPEQAISHLTRLCGRTHRVITAVAVMASGDPTPREVTVESRVALRAATPQEIRAYVATGEPLDKAGAYAFQGLGRGFVLRVIGSETNVIGLPMQETLGLLAAFGVVAERDA